eukprot:gene32474-39263_t
MLLGSSITQRSFSVEHRGWGSALQHWYSRTADVLNRGAGGYNSRWLWKYLPQLLGSEKPDMTVLFIGNNDSIQEAEHQHVPINEFQHYVLSILRFLHGVKRNMIVLVVSTTQSDEALRPRHNNRVRLKYAETLRSIVQSHKSNPNFPANMQFVDLITDCSSHRVEIDDLCDGAHLNSSGNHKVYQAIKECINTHYPSFSPDSYQHTGRGRPKAPCNVTPSPTTIIHTSTSSSSLTNSPSSLESHDSPLFSTPAQFLPPFEPVSLSEEEDDGEVPSLRLTVPIWHDLV